MNKITIQNSQHEARTFRTKKGDQMTKYEQRAYVWLEGKPFPVEFVITRWPDRETGEIPEPYPAGEYRMLPKVVAVSRFNEPIFGFDLRPVAEVEKIPEGKRA